VPGPKQDSMEVGTFSTRGAFFNKKRESEQVVFIALNHTVKSLSTAVSLVGDLELARLDRF
jgi:hypothetical protein